MSTLSDFVFVIVDTNDSEIRNKILEHGGNVLMRYVKKVKYAILDCGEDNLTKDVSKKIESYKEKNVSIVTSDWVEKNFLSKSFDDDGVMIDDVQKSLKRTCDEDETDSKKKKEETKDDSTKSIFTDCKFIFVGKSSIPIGKLKSLVKSNDGEIVMDPDEATVCICTLDSYINKIKGLTPILQRTDPIPLYTPEYIVDKVEDQLQDIKQYDVQHLFDELSAVNKPEKIVKVTRRKDDLIAVDMYVPDTVRDSTQVYVEGDVIWSAMLNQSDLRDNHNKFYLLQILQSVQSFDYYLFFRWGRVGDKGQQKLEKLSLDQCKSGFEKKFFDKTCNTWENRDKFKPAAKKYTYIKMKISKHDDPEVKRTAPKKEEEKKEEVECKLAPELQEALRLLYNIKQFNEEMVEEGLDINKMPLGELDSETITKGYKVLLEIEKVLKNTSYKSLDDLCSQFYTLIPHDFGRKHMSYFRIDNLKMLQRKIDLLSCLSNMKQYSVIAKKDENDTKEHPLTIKYNNLRCTLELLPSEDAMYKFIMDYASVRGETHSFLKFHVVNIFKMHRLDEHNNITVGTTGNVRLLWHGTQLINCVSILSRGLLIAPPEAQITGHMFGKGVYFADVISKSAQYCRASSTYPRCFMLLAEVDTGKEKELINADYNANNDLNGYDTVKGCGSHVPSKWTTYNGVKIPSGPLKNLKASRNLLYNEYIVYDTNRISLKYLVEVEFEY